NRSARRASADGFYVVSLRRLHPARGERHHRAERIDRAGPFVPRGAKTARVARRAAVIARARHLPEERLIDCYLAERAGESLDPRAADHLVDCAVCTARYNELAGFLEELRSESEVEADAVFTPERLRAQQQAVRRRIDHVGRAARVITFPDRAM